MPWNPSAPDTLGMEFAPTRSDTATVGAEGSAYAVAFTAEATRTLVPGGLGAGIQVTTAGDWTVELYREADYLAALTDVATAAAFAPTADRHWSGAWTFPTDVGPGNYWQAVVGAPGSAANANFLVLGGPAHPQTTTFYAARFGGLTIPAGRRLLVLRLLADREVVNVPEPNSVSAVETPFADCADATLTRITAEERPAGLNARQTVAYTFRPRNVLAAGNHAGALAPWAASGSGWGLILTSYSGTNLQANVFHLSLVADHVPERRLAWGTGVRFGGADASGLAQVAPLGDRWTAWASPGAAPTITAGERYVLLMRGPKYSDRSPFVARLPMLTPGPPITGYSSGRVRCTADGIPTQAVPTDRVGAPLYTGTPTSGPSYPPTSQPAVDVMAWPRSGCQPLLGEDVMAWQRITVTTAVTVGQVVVPVARPDYLGASPLTIRIYDDATPNVPQGGAFFLTTDQWDALPGPYVMGGRTVKNVRATLPTPLALAPGNWWIVASTTDAHPLDEATPWAVLYLEAFTINAHPGPPASFYPESPDLAPSVGGRVSSALAVVLPAPIAGFHATRTPAQLVPASEACDGRWDTAVLTWTPTALAADRFWRYELERLDDDAEGWQRIAHVEDPAGTTFTDREGRRGRAVRYRIRQMRPDGGTSAWVESPGPWRPLACCGIGLVTNAPAEVAPSLFFTDLEPVRTYANLDADGLVLRPVYGADYQQAFHPTERRGVVLETQLLVRHGPATDGLGEWDQLRRLARADVAVAVLTERGDRFWSAIAVPELTTSPRRGLQVYYAALQATQVADAPTVVTVAKPPPVPTTAGTFHLGPHPNDLLDRNFFLGF